MADAAAAEPAGDGTPGSFPPDPVPEPPVAQSHHRDVQGGIARASVFGANDGLVSNVSLILGVAGATTSADFVRVAGVAGLVAGAVSMAFGEWISMRAQQELLERELDLEREQLRRNPNKELVELTLIYQSRGVDPDIAQEMAQQMMADPERALEVHAREELGIDPSSLGSPVGAATSSFFAFAAGALVPLVPWFFLDGAAAVITSLVLGLLAALALGVSIATFTGKSKLYSALRQAAVVAGAAALTYGIGSMLGVEVGT
jgi:VIT1/CCC1 family predicted Fe2+/Mn2+ transporter